MTNDELNKIKKILPRRYLQELTKRIEKEISVSLVRSVMNNSRADYYGIIDTAIQWGLEIKRTKNEQTEIVKNL